MTVSFLKTNFRSAKAQRNICFNPFRNRVPRENHLTHPQAELVLSHMWPVRARTYTSHSGEMIEWLRALKYSDLAHSAMGAARNGIVSSCVYVA